MKVYRLSFAVIFILLLSAVASSAFSQAPEFDATAEIWDPIEPVNRGVFWFNDKADLYLMEPLARGCLAQARRRYCRAGCGGS